MKRDLKKLSFSFTMI